jgi:hypothetical protein
VRFATTVRAWAKLITLLAAGFIGLVVIIAAVKAPRPTSDPRFVPRVITKTTAEVEAENASAQAERQLEAERQRQAARQQEIERRQEEASRLQRAKAYQAAISKCVEDVRRPDGMRNVFSKFDMYTTKNGELRGWGTEHEVYLFNKCMQQRGYDTQLEWTKNAR